MTDEIKGLSILEEIKVKYKELFSTLEVMDDIQKQKAKDEIETQFIVLEAAIKLSHLLGGVKDGQS